MNLLNVRPLARIHTFVHLPAALRGWRLASLLVLCVMGVVGLLVSPERELSAFRFALFAIGIATYVATVAGINSPRRFARAFDVLMFVAFAVTLFSLLGTQYETYRFLPIESITRFIPHLPSSWLRAIGEREGLNANEVAGVLAAILPVLLGVVLWRGLSRARFTLALVTLALMAFYLLLSLSRSAWLALLLPVIGLLWWRKWWLGAGALCLSVLGAIVALNVLSLEYLPMLLFSDLTMPQWFAVPTRYVIWQHALDLIRASPLTGVGIGAFARIFHTQVANQPFYANVDIANAHNLVLQAALDVGVPGMLAYVALLLAVSVSAVRVARSLRGTSSAGAAYGLAAGLFAFLLYGTLQVVTLTARAAPLVWYVIALAAASPILRRDDSAD